jgi:NTP pyrophosphatase (non-canonical NTP hydrolase)
MPVVPWWHYVRIGMKNLQEFTQQIVSFRDARDWKQFHGLKDIALSLMLEAGEVGEIFQFKNEAEVAAKLNSLKERIGEELSDVIYWTLLMAHDSGVDLEAAFERKMAQNEDKYPVEKAKGSNKKYTDLS